MDNEKPRHLENEEEVIKVISNKEVKERKRREQLQRLKELRKEIKEAEDRANKKVNDLFNNIEDSLKGTNEFLKEVIKLNEEKH